MGKKKPDHLTKSERIFMEILWDAGRPLSRPEVVELAQQQHGVAMPMSTFHLLVNRLLEIGYISPVAEPSGRVKRHTRQFVPKVTRNEHFALQIVWSDKFVPGDIPSIVCALFRFARVPDPVQILRAVEAELNPTPSPK